MSGKNKRSFRLSPEQEKFVGAAKVQTDAQQHNPAQHSTEVRYPAQHGKQRKIPRDPWDTQFGTSTYNFKFPAEMYAMALWLGEYAPGGPSLAELIRMGLARVLPELVDMHYKPEE